MIYKNISTRSNEILSFFRMQDKSFFHYKDAIAALSGSSEGAVRELLSDMTKRGLLMRVKKGLYCIIPFEDDPEIYMPDWHLLVEHLVKDAAFYIGYYSALHVHNLITQPSMKEQVVVSKQLRPSSFRIKNIPFQFIYHNDTHFFGQKRMWIDNYNKVICSDLEKTLIDCLFNPSYGGGIIEIAKAIYRSKDSINFETLLDYAIRFNSQAVKKRLGFILELLEIDTPIISKLSKNITNSYILLDTELPKEGKMTGRWRIQQNVDINTIKSDILT